MRTHHSGTSGSRDVNALGDPEIGRAPPGDDLSPAGQSPAPAVSPACADEPAKSKPVRAPAAKRVDIQVLRAIAVTVVVLFHLEIGFFTGGFIGVDVFFVVSGYLVFGSLLREIQHCKFELMAFLSRRMKRLSMPSGVMLTLLSLGMFATARCAEGGCLLSYGDVRAAALHGANLKFLYDSDDYFKPSTTPSIVLHFWSLAVEEQLYIVIPLLLLPLPRIASRLCRGVSISSMLGWTLVTLCAGSLSLIFFQPTAWKFFFFASRLWEFGAGAMVAHWEDTRKQGCEWKARPFSQIGVVHGTLYVLAHLSLISLALVVPAVGYPNYLTVVVVVITAYIIWRKVEYTFDAGETIGNMSYSLYLYHWPIIQLVNFYEGQDRLGRVPDWSISVTLSAVLATMSYFLVEKPIQSARWSKKRTVSVFLLCTLLPATIASVGTFIADRDQMAAVNRMTKSVFEKLTNSGKLGTLSANETAALLERLPPWQTSNPFDLKKLRQHCDDGFIRQQAGEGDLWMNERKRSKEVIISLMGDSHSRSWWPALHDYAEGVGASFISARRNNNLPGNHPMFVSHRVPNVWPNRFDRYKHHVFVLSGRVTTGLMMKNYNATISFWAQRDTDCVVVIADNPYMPFSPSECLKHSTPDRCSQPQSEVLPKVDVEMFRKLKEANPDIRAEMIDVNDLGCWDGVCHSNIYDVPLWEDEHHWSGIYTNFIRPYVLHRIRKTKCFQDMERMLAKSS